MPVSVEESKERLGLRGGMNSPSLRSKVSVGIVAHASILLLWVVMDVPGTDNDRVVWYVIPYGTLELSVFTMGTSII